MQAGMTPADRPILAIAGGLLAALTLMAMLAAPVSETGFNPVPSSYLSSPGGARAAFVLLQRLGMPAQRWEEPPFQLVNTAPFAVLVLAEPTERPSHAENSALRRFVENGGRILFCGAELSDFFPEVQLQKLFPEPNAAMAGLEKPELPREQYPPIDNAAGLQRIELRAQAMWQNFRASQAPVYGVADNAVVAVWALGKGELIWWAGATPLTNGGLEHAGNLELFLSSVGTGAGRRVYWDEYFHGERGSLWDYVGRVPAIRWAVIQMALLAGACLLAFGRRSGPVIAPVKISRLSPLEFVDTLGNLYRKAKAAPVAIDVPLRQLRLQLSRRLALPVAISDQELALAAAARLGWSATEFETVLVRGREATARRSISPSSALQLVQAIQGFTAWLNNQ